MTTVPLRASARVLAGGRLQDVIPGVRGSRRWMDSAGRDRGRLSTLLRGAAVDGVDLRSLVAPLDSSTLPQAGAPSLARPDASRARNPRGWDTTRAEKDGASAGSAPPSRHALSSEEAEQDGEHVPGAAGVAVSAAVPRAVSAGEAGHADEWGPGPTSGAVASRSAPSDPPEAPRREPHDREPDPFTLVARSPAAEGRVAAALRRWTSWAPPTFPASDLDDAGAAVAATTSHGVRPVTPGPRTSDGERRDPSSGSASGLWVADGMTAPFGPPRDAWTGGVAPVSGHGREGHAPHDPARAPRTHTSRTHTSRIDGVSGAAADGSKTGAAATLGSAATRALEAASRRPPPGGETAPPAAGATRTPDAIESLRRETGATRGTERLAATHADEGLLDTPIAGVAWLEEDDLADRLHLLLSRQARRRGIEVVQ